MTSANPPLTTSSIPDAPLPRAPWPAASLKMTVLALCSTFAEMQDEMGIVDADRHSGLAVDG